MRVPDKVALSAILAAAICCLWMVSLPVWSNQLYLQDDLQAFNIPIRFLYAQGLHAGRIDTWTPALYNGLYLHGEGQAGMYHPVHLLLYRCLPFTLAVGSEIFAAYLALWTGAALLFHRWSGDWIAAWFGALIFSFAGPLLPSIVHINKMDVLAHIPWTLLALDHCIRTSTARKGYACLAVALLNGSAILFGYPYFFLLLVILQGWYITYLLFEQRTAEGLLRSIAAIATGSAIGAVQLLPTWDVLQHSSRSHPTFKFLASGSLYLIDILQWVNPYFFQGRVANSHTYGPWELSIYAGIGPILLFLWIATRRVHQQNRLRAFLLLLAAAGLFLAFGENNRLFRYYYDLPVLSFFRMPCRFSLLCLFAIAGGSSIALKELRVLAVRPALPRAFNIAVVALVLASVASLLSRFIRMPGLHRLDTFAAPATPALLGCILFCIGVGLFYAAVRYRGWWFAAFCVFAVCDIDIYALTFLHANPSGPFNTSHFSTPPVPPPATLIVNYAGDDSLVYRGYSVANAYTGLQPPVLHSMADPQYLRSLGVAAVEDISGTWVPLNDPAPPVRFEQPLLSAQPIEAMKTNLDWSHIAVVSQPVPTDAGATGSVRIVDQHPGLVHLETDTSGRKLCVLIQRFHPGWTAATNGHKLELFPVNGDLTGFVPPVGHQQITLTFHPKSLTWGLRITCLSLLLLASVAMAQWLRHRNSKVRPSGAAPAAF